MWKTIEVIEANIIYKINMVSPQSHLISEVNWALWKNRCSNVYDKTFVSHIGVVKSLFYRLQSISQVDKVILSIRAYTNRWLGLNQVIQALDF